MTNVWGKPIGKPTGNDGRTADYNNRKEAHTPKVLNPDGTVFQQPKEQKTSNAVGTTDSHTQSQNVSRNGVRRQ